MKKILVLLFIALSIKAQVVCTITKATYKIEGSPSCVYSCKWEECIREDIVILTAYDFNIQKSCDTFAKPLKGKKVKEVTLGQTIR